MTVKTLKMDWDTRVKPLIHFIVRTQAAIKPT